MRSHPCHVATSAAVALADSSRVALHGKCPGACIHDGAQVRCDCDCHNGEEDLRFEGRLPLAVGVSAPPPALARADTRRRSRAGNGRCEHCGAPTGGRFAPGHDAKLKSVLWKGVKDGNYKDWAELLLRGWLPEKISSDIPHELVQKGEAFAKLHPDLVARRSHVRQSGGDTVST